MRNWNSNDSTLFQPSNKSSAQKLNESEITTMAPDLSKIAQADSGLPQSKHGEQEKEISTSTAFEPTTLPPSAPFTLAAEKKLLRKLDLHLIPFLALLYLLCYLDRTNVGNARLVNLEKDLGMKGLDYNIALSIFFPFYVAAEVPSNMMLKRTRPSIWFTFIMLCWGLVMTCMGLVHNFSGLLACRVFLGIAEGGLFPGVSYFITMWYRRHECGLRLALFFSAATVAGAFGGLLARGISEMAGIGGKDGWSWIFILEGLMTLVVASFSYFVINDYPATAKFLTPEERTEVQRRLIDDCSLSDDFHLKYAIQAFRDWKIWVTMFITIGSFTPLYSISLFLPTIIKELGYTANESQLMTVPVYVVACFCTICGSLASDKIGQRGPFIMGFALTAVTGFVMLISSAAPRIQYAGTFLAASGIFPTVPLITTWNSNNIGGSLKRGVGIAMQVGFGNLGGAIAGFVYLSTDEPRFIKGHAILIGLISMSFTLSTCMTYYYRRENRRRDAEMRNKNMTIGDYSSEMMWEEREMGDDASFFRYTV